jgi:hypothetical protein
VGAAKDVAARVAMMKDVSNFILIEKLIGYNLEMDCPAVEFERM